MKLTGKALDAFGDQCKYNYDEFIELPESFQNALIIEFFDSVGIWNKAFLECYDNGLGNYKEATNAGIIKANLIYNESKL